MQVQDYLVFGFDFGLRLRMLTALAEDREHSSLLQRKIYPYIQSEYVKLNTSV